MCISQHVHCTCTITITKKKTTTSSPQKLKQSYEYIYTLYKWHKFHRSLLYTDSDLQKERNKCDDKIQDFSPLFVIFV
jgi:hypothetical protein